MTISQRRKLKIKYMVGLLRVSDFQDAANLMQQLMNEVNKLTDENRELLAELEGEGQDDTHVGTV